MENLRTETGREEPKNVNWRELELFGGYDNGSDKFESNCIHSSRFTLWNVVPKSIFEQLQRFSNLWFLFIVCISFSNTEDTLWHKLSRLIPLVFILGINLLKDISGCIELRNSDKKLNSHKYFVWNGQEFVEKLGMKILVGDIVLILDNESIPADILLLYVQNTNGCYADTSLVLGERNLQVKASIKDTQRILSGSDLDETISNLKRLNGNIFVKAHNRDQGFFGKIKLKASPRATSLNENNLLLRGTQVVNTQWIIGYVVYTGFDTSYWIKKKRFNKSITDTMIEAWTFWIIVGTCAFIFLAWMIGVYHENCGDGYQLAYSFLKISEDLVPISFFLVINFVRVGRVFQINRNCNGITVKDPECLEDLGLVEYVVADKTGTVTQNELSVQVCIIGEKVYWKQGNLSSDENAEFKESSRGFSKFETDNFTFREIMNEIQNGSKPAFHYLLCMALCNHTSAKQMGEEYFSLSVDDRILVETAALLGVKLLTRTHSACTLNFNGDELEFLVLGYENYSDSTKKCRILVRDPRQSCGYLYIKGSKEEMLDIFHLTYDEKTSIEEFTLSKNLIRMRTILMGFKRLSSQELEEFDFSYQTALSSPINSSGRVDAVFEQLEKNCEYLGIAALEDVINRETRQCLSLFSQAGIKTWITSGDNEESTLTAGVSSRLFEENVRVVRLTNFTSEIECREVIIQQIKEHILHEHNIQRENSNSFYQESDHEDNSSDFRIKTEPLIYLGGKNSEVGFEERKVYNQIASVPSPREIQSSTTGRGTTEEFKVEFNPNSVYFVLSIDKTGLEYGLSNDETTKLFISLLFAAHCVCFHSLQFEHKTRVIKLLKRNFRFKPVVLAIGDGPSDAGMIRQAHIGVGISRPESQLANVSNFSVTNFSQLQTLLLTQGHWCCINFSTLLMYSIYCKFLTTTVLLLFNSVSQMCGNLLIDDEFIAMYCIVLPVIQMFGVGLFDKDISESKLYSYPQVYSLGIHKKIITLQKFIITIAEAILHGFIVSLIFYLAVNNTTSASGKPLGVSETSLSMSICIFIVCSIKLLVDTHSLYSRTIIGHAIATVILIIHLFVNIYNQDEWIGYNEFLWNSPTLPIAVLTVPTIIFVAKYTIKASRSLFWPDVLEYVKLMKFNELSFDLIPRLDAFKDELRKVYLKSTHLKSKKDPGSLELNNRTLSFSSEQQETEYNVGKVIEYLKQYRILLGIGAGLLIVFMICILSTESNLSPEQLSVLPCLILLYTLVVPISFTNKFKRSFRTIIAIYYVLLLGIFMFIFLMYDVVTVDGFAFLLIIFFIAFNSDWFFCLLVSILSTIIAFIISYLEFKGTAESGLLISLFMVNYIGVVIISAAVGYSIDKTKRLEYILIRKVEIEVDKSKSVLSYLLPAFVRKRVKDGARYIAEDQGTVSVLFCDIMDFEEIVALFTPAELTAFLDDVFGKFDQMCSVVGVTKIETVGKTYMACAGLRDSDAEMDPNISMVSHARRAIEMGLAIIRAVNSIQLRKGVTLNVKIGINSGVVTAGVIGFHKPQFSLVGDTVNIASRMSSTCPAVNTLQISKSTYELVEDKRGLVFTHHMADVKGKGNMETWLVRVPVGLLETSLNEVVIQQYSGKVAGSPLALASRAISLYHRGSFAEISHERRLSALLTHLEIEDAVQLFQRKDTELIEQVQWFSLRCKERKKEKIFRIETVENNKPVIRLGMIVIIICNLIGIVFYAVISSLKSNSHPLYLGKLCCETIFEIFLLFGLKSYVKELWYAWSIQLVYIISIVAEIIISFFEERDIHLQYISIIAHIVLFSHCAELFFKHNVWSLILVTILWIAHAENQCTTSCLLTSVYLLISVCTLIFTVYTSERNLRINSTLKAAANKELDKTEKLIKQMMPPHVVQNLKEQSTITDKISQVTVVYADIVGFTSWSSNKFPEEVINMLSELFTTFDKNCVLHNVYKVHTIGDCYVAMGFTGQANRDPAKECYNILEFAKEMLDIIKNSNLENGTELNMRVGVHTGDVIAGVTGTSIVRYDIYGSDVMIANKIESCGQPGRILVSDATKSLIESYKPGEYQFISHIDFYAKSTKRKIITHFLSLPEIE